MGLSCDQISDLLPIWGGANCGAAHDRVGRLIEEKKGEIAERIAELEESLPNSPRTRGAGRRATPGCVPDHSPAACRSQAVGRSRSNSCRADSLIDPANRWRRGAASTA